MKHRKIVVLDDADRIIKKYTNIGGAWVYQRGPYNLTGGDRPYVTVPVTIEALEWLADDPHGDDDGRELALV